MTILIIISCTILLLAVYLIYKNIQDNKLLRTVTQNGRGTWSERDLIIKLLKAGFQSTHVFHDLYIKKKDGTYSQIDIALVTEVGVIVIEVKKYSGWIYGMGNREKWTQVLDYGKSKYSFYNPVFQNNGHIRSIQSHLPSYINLPIYSLVVFYGNCELKKISNIPCEVQIVKANKSIRSINNILQNPPLEKIYLDEVLYLLKKGVENGNDLEIQNLHIQNIQKITDKY